MKNRDSSVGIALGYGLDDRGSRVRLPAGAGNFSLHHRVQKGSGAHPASYRIGIRGSFPGGKAAMAWSSPLTSHLVPRSRMCGAIPPLSQYAFLAWCPVEAQEQLYIITFTIRSISETEDKQNTKTCHWSEGIPDARREDGESNCI
jgi:hypothetical protein